MPEPERFRITVQAVGEGPPVAIRLRHLLKAMLRSWGLKCVRIEPAGDHPLAVDPPQGTKPL